MAEKIYGWSRGVAIGQNLGELIIEPARREAHEERTRQLLQTAMNSTVGARFTEECVRRDGTNITVEIAVTALRRRDGYVFNAFSRDITERIAAEEQLRQSQKMEAVGQLTGGIAHDFNNILTVITSTIDSLADAVKHDAELAGFAKLISGAADRGAALASQLLAFARRQPLRPRLVDIKAWALENERLLRRTLGEQVQIELCLEEDVWPTLVDPTQLTTAVLNLAVNARDAMPNGGKLTFAASNVELDRGTAADVEPGPYVMIAVSDTGRGIPEAIRQRVFEPFFTTKGVGKGTGLGLSMVYGFVRQSDVHIELCSEEGYGTTFMLYLPRANVEAPSLAAP
jgi:PAS domain S-box-containing protein